MTNTPRSPTVASHPWTSIDHPINANPPPERTMAISHPVVRIGPTFGNFNAAKKRQPLIQRKLASTPVMTREKRGYRVNPGWVYL